MALLGSALSTAGLLFSHTPEIQEQSSIRNIPENMKPSGNNVYDSNRWRQARDTTQKEANAKYIQGFDTKMSNIVPSNYNQIWSPSVPLSMNRTTLPSEKIIEQKQREEQIRDGNARKREIQAANDSAFYAITNLGAASADVRTNKEGFWSGDAEYAVKTKNSALLKPYAQMNPRNIASAQGSYGDDAQKQKNTWITNNTLTEKQFGRLPENDPNGWESGIIGVPSTTGQSGIISGQFRPEDYAKFGVVHPNANPKTQTTGLYNTDVTNVPGFGVLGPQQAQGGVEGFNPTISGPQKNPDAPFHNNMTPFFGSHRTQNTLRPHDEKLEAFTGSLSSETQFRMVHKKELARDDMFKPTFGLSHPYGTPNLGNYGRDRFITSRNKNNVNPNNEIRVGPGLNQKGYDWKPADGFHSVYRPPQYNVDDLRSLGNPKLSYRGRVLRGREDEGRRGFIGKTYKRNPDRFYVNSQDRYFTSTVSDTLKPKFESKENYLHAFEETNRQETTQSYGGIWGPAAGQDEQRSYGAEYNMQAPLKENYKQIGPSGVYAEGRAGEEFDYGRSGQYGYDSPQGDHIQEGYWASPQERDTTEAAHGSQNVRGAHTKQNERSTMRHFDKARTTISETLPHWAREASGAYSGQNERGAMRHFDRAKTTKVETLPHWARESSGAHTKQNERSTMRLFDRARTTKVETLPHWARESAGAHSVEGLGNPRDRQDAENMEHTGERERILRERRPTPQSVSTPNGMEAVNISIRQRDLVDQNARNQTSGANPGDKQWQPIPDKWQQGVQGRTMNKVLSESIRQPEDYLVQEHRRNPYSKPLSSVAAY